MLDHRPRRQASLGAAADEGASLVLPILGGLVAGAVGFKLAGWLGLALGGGSAFVATRALSGDGAPRSEGNPGATEHVVALPTLFATPDTIASVVTVLPTKTFTVSSEVVTTVASRMKAAGYTWRDDGSEKFRDPRFAPECGGGEDGGPYTMVAGRLPGQALEYLNESGPGLGRVALLRSRVEAPLQPSNVTRAMAYQSELSLREAAQNLAEKIQDPASWPAIAEHVGIPVTKLVEAEGALEAAINNATRTYMRVDVMSLFKDLRATLGGALGDALAAQVSQIGKALAGTQAIKDGASFIGDVSSSVSAIMPFIKVIVDRAIEIDAAKRGAWASECVGFTDTHILRPIRETLDIKMPPAWHALDVWHVEDATWCPKPGFLTAARWTPSGDQEGAARDAREALAQMRGLGVLGSALSVKRWWMVANLLAADDLVQHTLSNLGRVRGLFGSDEQVALVGIPVAVANGLDPWPFVELLYGYARGWSAVDPTPCATNAWALNFADLSRCAFALAEALKSP